MTNDLENQIAPVGFEIPVTEHDLYWPVLEAVATFVEELLDDQARLQLERWSTSSHPDLSGFLDDLQAWPYAGDPLEASRTDLLFWAFKCGDEIFELKNNFEREIKEAAVSFIDSLESPVKELVIEACSFGKDHLPAGEEVSDVEMHNSAVSRLANKVRYFLTEFDRDFLLES